MILLFYISFFKKINFAVVFNLFSINLSRFHDLDHEFCRLFLDILFFLNILFCIYFLNNFCFILYI